MQDFPKDLMFVAITVVFFAITLAAVHFCEKLRGR